MFSRRNCSASNVQIMQLFHEIKQQFPTISDQVISACISSQILQKSKVPGSVEDISKIVSSLEHLNCELMGRSASSFISPRSGVDLCRPVVNSESQANTISNRDIEHRETSLKKSSDLAMSNTSNIKNSSEIFKDSKDNCKLDKGRSLAQRPTNLNLRPDTLDKNVIIPFRENNSCTSNQSCDKPLKPTFLTSKSNKDENYNECDRQPVVVHPSADDDSNNNTRKFTKKETVETPTQTTDTLLGEPAVNFSVNVNYSMDYRSQDPDRHTSSVKVTPVQPWLHVPTSQRNYTSVNLTLRPPSSAPQPPIDITSKNSCLTYSTKSFDSQKGLQSRLQITVGPSGSTVASLRTRPKSSYHPNETDDTVVLTRAESLPDLGTNKEPVISKQQARIERLKIELSTEKAKLVILRKDVSQLENGERLSVTDADVLRMEDQLKKEIRHLRFQCEQLASVTNRCNMGQSQEQFYHNIYTGQKGSLQLDVLSRLENDNISRSADNSSKWHCHLCTFLNHPDLNKCEQCEMGRILYGFTSTNTC